MSVSRGLALITGGSRGIGAASALRLAQVGHPVMITYRSRSDEADRVADACRATDVDAWTVRFDAEDPDGADALFAQVDEVIDQLNDEMPVGLGAVINNAGIVPELGPVESYPAGRVERVLAVNVRSPFQVAAHAVRRMSTRHGGSGGVIVNVSSRAAALGGPGEYVDYAASKAAIDAMTLGLAKEVGGDGIRVVGVRPGLIETDIHAPGRLDRMRSGVPIGRTGTADEVAAVIAWLVGPDASYVTGTTVDVSGGR